MSEFLDMFGFPPHPIGGVCLIVLSLLWGVQAKRKLRPYLLALQVAIISGLLARIIIFLREGSGGFTNLLEFVASVTIGQVFMFWAIAWLIIKLTFLLRARSDSSNIFTRNRNS